MGKNNRITMSMIGDERVTFDHLKARNPSRIARITISVGRSFRRNRRLNDYFLLVHVISRAATLKINGDDARLVSGDLVFIRPTDEFSISAAKYRLEINLISITSDLIVPLATRHPDLNDRLFWTQCALPQLVHAYNSTLANVECLIERLALSSCNRLATEAFILQICSSLIESFSVNRSSPASGSPDWLVEACAAAQDPTVFRQGATGFVRVTGRTHAHVCRAMRLFLGMTPSSFVNQIRMDYAARVLLQTNRTIAEVARDCGLPNLSHFHKVFLEHHGTTPLKFKKRSWPN